MKEIIMIQKSKSIILILLFLFFCGKEDTEKISALISSDKSQANCYTKFSETIGTCVSFDISASVLASTKQSYTSTDGTLTWTDGSLCTVEAGTKGCKRSLGSGSDEMTTWYIRSTWDSQEETSKNQYLSSDQAQNPAGTWITKSAS